MIRRFFKEFHNDNKQDRYFGGGQIKEGFFRLSEGIHHHYR